MKSFKSIREGNSVEPGVSEIDDVPEDPLSYVEIKPKKTKVVKEGIVDTAANAKVRIFSSIDRKKKELYKNAVKEDIQEAVTVKKEKYSWGKMMTVHHGSDTSYPLHPEHQEAIAKLGDGEKTSFKDETNSSVHAEREGDTVHLTRPRLSSTKTSVAHSHFNEELEQGVAEGVSLKQKYEDKKRLDQDQVHYGKMTQAEFDKKWTRTERPKPTDKKQGVAEGKQDTVYPKAQVIKSKRGKEVGEIYQDENGWGSHHYKSDHGGDGMRSKEEALEHLKDIHNERSRDHVAEETLSELKKSTLSSYIKKAANSATMSAYGAGGESQRHAGEPVSKRPDTYGADRKVALKRLAGIGKATDRLEKNVNEEWTKTGKTGTHIASGEKTFEWAKVDSEGKQTGERHYRNAAGKVMGEETEQIAELNKDTVYSYAAKAEKDVDKKHKELTSQIKTNNPLSANKTSSKIVKRYAGMDRAETRLNKEETEQGVAENVAGNVNSKERYHVLYPHVPLDMHKDHEYNKLSDRDLQAVKSHQRELADKLGKPGAEEQSDIASHIQINRARSQHDQEQAHRRKILDAEKVKRQAREAKRNQQGVAEGSETAADIDKKIEFHKQGQAAAQYKGSMNKMHAAKIRELEDKQRNKIPAVSEGIDFLKVWESIKPVEVVVEEETVDPVALKKEADRIMELNIAARKAK